MKEFKYSASDDEEIIDVSDSSGEENNSHRKRYKK